MAKCTGEGGKEEKEREGREVERRRGGFDGLGHLVCAPDLD